MTTINETMSQERSIRRHTLRWVGSAIIISLTLAAFLMRSWTTFWIALPLGVAYVLLVTMPVFLGIVSGDDKEGNNS